MVVLTEKKRSELLKELSQTIPYKWRVQSVSKHKPQATCVAYIDARDVADVLDQYCVEGWQNQYQEIAGNLFCGIAIKMSGEWEWRWDCGTESNTEKEKGRASDAFKRAAVKWGVGRFLYDLGFQYIATNEAKTGNNSPYPVDEQGKRVWDLTEFLNKKLAPKTPRKENFSEPIAPKILPNPVASKAELIEKKLGALASRFFKGKEWLEASLKGRHITYETMTKAQFEEFEKLIPTLTPRIIEEDIGILKSSTSEKLLENGVAPEEVAKMGIMNTSPKAEIDRTLKKLEPLPDTKEVSTSDLIVLINYAKSLDRKEEVSELERMIDKGLGLSKMEFLEFLGQFQSAKSN